MQYTLGIILTGVPQFRSSATHSNTLKYLKYQMQYTLGIILTGVPQFRNRNTWNIKCHTHLVNYWYWTSAVPQFRSSATHSNTLKYLKYQMQYTLGIILTGVPQFRNRNTWNIKCHTHLVNYWYWTSAVPQFCNSFEYI